MRGLHGFLALGLLLAACGSESVLEQCETAADCDDGNACTTDTCDLEARCAHAPVAVDDGDACTLDACEIVTGLITHGPVDTSDGDPCTVDACDPATGDVSHTPVELDDDDACTIDACNDWTGEVTHAPVATDDGDPCTSDLCDSTSGAVTHPAIDVDDLNACTVDACDAFTGEITHAPVEIDDGDACTVDACDTASGAISHTPLAAIDDDDACTVDACDTASGAITHTPLAAIDDGDACTTDACVPATGAIAHTPVAIDDEDACTVDACDPASGAITHLPIPAVDDGVACTTDTCDDGTVAHLAVDAACDDGIDCTLDTCDAIAGCGHAANDLACPAGLACVAPDGCVTQECYPGKVIGTLDEAIGASIYTSDQTDLTSGSCGGEAGPEVVLALRPSLDLEQLLVWGYDMDTGMGPLLYLRTDCPDRGTEIACSWDGAMMPAYVGGAVAGETYYVFADGTATQHGAFDLWVEGVIATNDPCDPDLPNYVCHPADLCRESAPGAGDFRCTPAQCADGLDNDGDGFIDYPYEPSCASPQDDDESFPVSTACSDGEDDDGDGAIDWPEDYGCQAAGDDDEVNECAPGVKFLWHPGGDMYGDTSATANSVDLPCNGAPGGHDDVWLFRADRQYTTLYLPMDAGFSFNAAAGMNQCAEFDVGCLGPFPPGYWGITWGNPPLGDLYFIIDGADPSQMGPYTFSIRGEIAPGERCDPMDPNFWCTPGTTCGASLTCELPPPPPECSDGEDNDDDGMWDYWDPGCEGPWDPSESPDPPEPPACMDGADNDGDGMYDFPEDPGCAAAGDPSELGECEDGEDNDGDGLIDDLDPACWAPGASESPDPFPLPECADGIDNDDDGNIDYPLDSDCERAADTTEGAAGDCPREEVLDLNLAGGVISSSTVGAFDDGAPSCRFDPANAPSGPDVTHTLYLAAPAQVYLSTCGSEWDTQIVVLSDPCTWSEEACNEDGCEDPPMAPFDSDLQASLLAGMHFVVVDGWNGETGSYTLSVSGTWSTPGCDPSIAFIACPPGLACVPGGPEGGVCMPAPPPP